MDLALYETPDEEPVTLAQMKVQLELDGDTVEDHRWDDLINDAIKSARQEMEDRLSRAFLTQTWDYYLDEFPCGNFIKLPFGNLQTVTSVKYTDSDLTETTMTVSTEYVVETNGDQCGRIVLPYGVTWPSFTPATSHPIAIRFVCGWTTAALVPYPIKSVIKLRATDLFVNREGQYLGASGQQYILNRTIDALLVNHRLWDTFE
jgi:uncharacterized phiE125 gp8 family phage protein